MIKDKNNAGISRRSLLASAAGVAVGAGIAASSAAETKPAAGRSANRTVNTVTTADGTLIHYKDWGSGTPVVFSHGWLDKPWPRRSWAMTR